MWGSRAEIRRVLSVVLDWPRSFCRWASETSGCPMSAFSKSDRSGESGRTKGSVREPVRLSVRFLREGDVKGELLLLLLVVMVVVVASMELLWKQPQGELS